MAIEKLSSPSNPPSSNLDWGYAVTLIEKAFLNEENGIRIDYDNDLVLKGSVFQVGGSVYIATADTSITGSASDYVKLTVSGSNLVPSYVANLTGVTWNSTYRGYYDVSGNLHVFDEDKAYYEGTIATVYKSDGKRAVNVVNYVESYTTLFKIQASSRAAADEASTGGSAQTLTWNTDDFNNITGASRSGNDFILPAGKYTCSGFIKVRRDIIQFALYNVTDAVIIGDLCQNDSVSDQITFPTFELTFSISSQKTVRVQYYTVTGYAFSFPGGANYFGTYQPRRSITFEKVIY